MAQPTRLPGGLSVTNRGSNIQKEVVFNRRSIPISFADGTTETATGFSLPTDAIVHNVFLYVKTAEATGTTKTIDVGTQGTSNDPDGYLDGVDVSSTGLVKGTLLNTGQTLGLLLTADEDGAGALVPEPDISAGGDEISWTPGSSDFAELEAEIIVEYEEVKDVSS